MTNILKLTHHEGTIYLAEYEWTRYRFLLSNGDTIDVWAVIDDSWLRDKVLLTVNKLTKAPKDHKYEIIIVGVASLPASSPTDDEPSEPELAAP